MSQAIHLNAYPEFQDVTITLYTDFIRIERPAKRIGALMVNSNFLLEDRIESARHTCKVIDFALRRLDPPF